MGLFSLWRITLLKVKSGELFFECEFCVEAMGESLVIGVFRPGLRGEGVFKLDLTVVMGELEIETIFVMTLLETGFLKGVFTK